MERTECQLLGTKLTIRNVRYLSDRERKADELLLRALPVLMPRRTYRDVRVLAHASLLPKRSNFELSTEVGVEKPVLAEAFKPPYQIGGVQSFGENAPRENDPGG
jgi:hypothetical protein